MVTKNKTLTEEQKQEIKKIVRLQAWIGLGIIFTLLGGIWGFSLREIYKQIKENTEKKVEYLVAEQFKEPKIQVIVEKAAETRASVLMSEQINPEVVKFKEEIASKNAKAEEKLSELNSKIQDANKAVAELQLLTRFNTVVINAQSDDRDAYDQLRNWGDDDSFPYQGIAIRTVNKMMIESSLFFSSDFISIDVIIPWPDKIDPNKLTLSQLLDFYKISTERTRIGVVQFIWLQRLDISKKERLQFLADVLKNDKSLFVCKIAGYYFQKGTGNGKATLGIKEHLEWWEKNKETVK